MSLTHRTVLGVAGAALSLAGVLGSAAGAEADAARYSSHRAAVAALTKGGMSFKIVSSGNCSLHRKGYTSCTSLDEVRKASITGIRAFKSRSRCAITITGGTEDGHAGGTTSRGKTHWMGWKLDVSPTTCVNKYVTSRFKYVGTRSDGAKLYKSPAGNIYARESNHWDILFNTAAA